MGAAAVLLMASLSHAQELRRFVKQADYNKDAPIQIVGINVGDKHFQKDFSVMGASGWWKELTLDVKNTSDRNILAFEIGGHFYMPPEAVMGMSLPFRFNSYTKDTGANALTLSGETKLGMLGPGETVRVVLPDWIIKQLDPLVTTYGYENVQGIRIEINDVYFEDKTGWDRGRYVPARETKTPQ